MIRTLAALSVFAVTLFAQRSVPPEFMYHRVYAVVPVLGAGTPNDPKHAMLVPTPPQPGQVQLGQSPQTGERPELLGWQVQYSDDGKFALVEFVFQTPLAYHTFLAKAAASPGSPVAALALSAVAADGSDVKSLSTNTAALKNAFESSVPGMKLLERGKTTQAEILTEFRKHKANFTFEGSIVRPQ
jgi:hypothetical protein